MRSALTQVPGVISADVALPDKAVIKYDKEKVSADKLIEAVKKAGYSAKVRTAKDEKK